MTCRASVRRTMPATAKGQGHMCFLGLEGQAAKVSVWPLIECATCHRMASLGYLTMTTTGNRFDCADHQPGERAGLNPATGRDTRRFGTGPVHTPSLERYERDMSAHNPEDA